MEPNSVSQVNHYIKNLFARESVLNRINVKGEVSNCKYHSSGHIYFTLKDHSSALSCVMFASHRNGLGFRMTEGQSVIVQGSVSVYERDGKYQLYAKTITQDGIGRLYEEYEKLKKRLYEEGLFDESRKKTIPCYATKIGVVTAQTGAVIQDICNVAQRRNPYVQIYLYPAKMQGEGAAQTIIRGIQYFEKTEAEIIIIGRGGGSIEDLWAFNDESLARVIVDCSKPVISAVGHETDVTISDYVASLRAPTPSAAAELAVFSMRDAESNLREASEIFKESLEHKIKLLRLQLLRYHTVLDHSSPEDLIRQRRLYLVDKQERMTRCLEQKLTSAKHQMELYVEELKGLSPLYKLQGGYSFVSELDGEAVTSVKQLEAEKQLLLTMKDGRARVAVEQIMEGEVFSISN